MKHSSVLTDEQIERRAHTIRIVYGWLAWLGGIGTFLTLIGLSGGRPRIQALEDVLSVWVYSFAYYGLKGRKGWIVPLLLVGSALILIHGLILILEPAIDMVSFLHKIGNCVFVLFCAYQLYLFEKREVRQFFSTEGRIVV